MGFCLLNNVAVAASALTRRGERVLIVDWDVHHGNGTQAIFWDDPAVLYVSTHEWPLYPGTGAANDYGAEPARGYTVNVPVPSGTGNDVYVSLTEHLVVPLARAFAPQLLLISAGFDAHRDDPLASCAVTEDGFAAMTSWMRQLASELAVPLGVVLEGGYALRPLARSVGATLEALISAPSVESVEIAEPAAGARRRLSEFWPELS